MNKNPLYDLGKISCLSECAHFSVKWGWANTKI